MAVDERHLRLEDLQKFSRTLKTRLEEVKNQSLMVDDALRAYGRALIRWSERYLDDLTLQFNAQAGFAEMRSAAPQPPGAATEAMRRDLGVLQRWNSDNPCYILLH